MNLSSSAVVPKDAAFAPPCHHRHRRALFLAVGGGILALLGTASFIRGMKGAATAIAAATKSKKPTKSYNISLDFGNGGIGIGSSGGGGGGRLERPGGSHSTSTGAAKSAAASGSGQPPAAAAVVDVDDTNEASSDGPVTTPWRLPNACERSQIIEGQWVPIRLKRPPYYPPSNNTSCNFKALYDSRGWSTHQWVPNDRSCVLGEWDAHTFCQLAQYATVLIVGDSLSWENYVSTIHLLGVKATHMYSRMSLDFGMNVGHAACGGHSRMAYRRLDYLENLRHALLENNTNLPQILVLNRGAHYTDDVMYMAGVRSALDVVQEWLGQCDQLEIKCHFFWRTTVPGHLNCRSFKNPVNDKSKIEAYVGNKSMYDNHTLTFHWYDFQHQNLLVEAELESRRKEGRLRHYRIIDGYHLNVLRPDRHSDCLHSCCPGKMDVYARLLLHYLRIDRTIEDVRRLRRVFEARHWDVNVTTPYVFCPSCQ